MSLQDAIERSTEDALEPRVLLAALLRQSDPERSADLARSALRDPGKFLSPFRHAELTATARLLLADPQNAVAGFLSAAGD